MLHLKTLGTSLWRSNLGFRAATELHCCSSREPLGGGCHTYFAHITLHRELRQQALDDPFLICKKSRWRQRETLGGRLESYSTAVVVPNLSRWHNGSVSRLSQENPPCDLVRYRATSAEHISSQLCSMCSERDPPAWYVLGRAPTSAMSHMCVTVRRRK